MTKRVSSPTTHDPRPTTQDAPYAYYLGEGERLGRATEPVILLVDFVDIDVVLGSAMNDDRLRVGAPFDFGGVVEVDVDAKAPAILLGQISGTPQQQAPVWKIRNSRW